MKILVFSDSHGSVNFMCSAIDTEKPDSVIHLGDCTGDAAYLCEKYPFLPVVSVKGNCDYADFMTPEQREYMYDSIKILCVHGHNYGVKAGLLRLYLAAKEKTVHIALFGHTHCAFCENRDNIWMMNPGTCRAGSRQTYGIIEISNGSAVCRIKTETEGKKL